MPSNSATGPSPLHMPLFLAISTSCSISLVTLGFKSSLRPRLLCHLCAPPLHLCLFLAHTDCVVLHLPSFSSAPSLPYSTHVYLVQVFYSLCQSRLSLSPSLSEYILVSRTPLALHPPPPFSFLFNNLSIWLAISLSHSGVQLSFIRFFRGKLRKKKALAPSYISLSLCSLGSVRPLSFPAGDSHSPPHFHLKGVCSHLHILSPVLILITNPNVITSILNNSSGALIS